MVFLVNVAKIGGIAPPIGSGHILKFIQNLPCWLVPPLSRIGPFTEREQLEGQNKAWNKHKYIEPTLLGDT